MAARNQRSISMRWEEARTRLMASMHSEFMLCMIPFTFLAAFLMMTYSGFDIALNMSAIDIITQHGWTMLSVCTSTMILSRLLLRRWTRLASILASIGWFFMLSPVIILTSPWLDDADGRFLPILLMISILITLCATASLIGNLLLLVTTYLPKRSAKE